MSSGVSQAGTLTPGTGDIKEESSSGGSGGASVADYSGVGMGGLSAHSGITRQQLINR